MKIIKTGLSILTVILSCACQNWLDVQPKTEVKSDLLFESESGFKDANIGCYMMMGSTSLYGKELTSGLIDVLGQQWTAGISTTYTEIMKYNYDGAEYMINSIWANMYTTIANINNILENIDGKRNILQPAVYHIFKGEALGLRAFLHFELLKIFGWGDLENHPEYLKQKCIPYVKKYNKVVTEQHTVEEALAFIHEDLEAAAELLDGYDPWSPTPTAPDGALVDGEGFFKNRMTRFNYWAVQATMARAYMWEGKRAEALRIAQRFIDNQAGIAGMAWVKEEAISATDLYADRTCSTEHIFRLDITNLYENLKSLIDPKDGLNDNYQKLYHPAARASQRFDSPAGDSDYRFLYLYDKSLSTEFTNRKFKNVEGATYKNMMPLIRMTEMYYIAAECLGAAGKDKEAFDLLNTVRFHRGIAPTYDLQAGKDNVQEQVEREYRKEFLGEGQMFYYYKRLGASTMLGVNETPVKIPEGSYILEIPEDEINTAGREPNKTTDKKE